MFGVFKKKIYFLKIGGDYKNNFQCGKPQFQTSPKFVEIKLHQTCNFGFQGMVINTPFM